MTCIIGLKTKRNVYIAGDSLLSYSNMGFEASPRKVFEIYRDDGRKYIFGVSGIPRIYDLFYTASDVNAKNKMLELPEFGLGNNDMENYCIMVEWVNRILIPTLIDCKIAGLNKNDENYAGADLDGNFFIGFQKTLFCVDRHFNTSIVENFQAIGAGEEFAVGILGYLKDNSDIHFYSESAEYDDIYYALKLKKILEIVSKYCMYVKGPFHIVKAIDRSEKKENK